LSSSLSNLVGSTTATTLLLRCLLKYVITHRKI
jgi:hypothetical protein